jgi:hypothetical protein
MIPQMHCWNVYGLKNRERTNRLLDRVTPVITGKQRIHGCTLTQRTHPQMRRGGAPYGANLQVRSGGKGFEPLRSLHP